MAIYFSPWAIAGIFKLLMLANINSLLLPMVQVR